MRAYPRKSNNDVLRYHSGLRKVKNQIGWFEGIMKDGMKTLHIEFAVSEFSRRGRGTFISLVLLTSSKKRIDVQTDTSFIFLRYKVKKHISKTFCHYFIYDTVPWGGLEIEFPHPSPQKKSRRGNPQKFPQYPKRTCHYLSPREGGKGWRCVTRKLTRSLLMAL